MKTYTMKQIIENACNSGAFTTSAIERLDYVADTTPTSVETSYEARKALYLEIYRRYKALHVAM